MNTVEQIPKTRKIVAKGLRKAITKYGVIPGLCVGSILPIIVEYLNNGRPQEAGLTDMLPEIVMSMLVFMLLFSGVAAYSWWQMRKIVAKADA